MEADMGTFEECWEEMDAHKIGGKQQQQRPQ
jgi:hypothetical protein